MIKIDYRKMVVRTICPKCPYYNDCGMDKEYDCEALKVLEKIYEDLDSNNPDA